MKKKIIFPKVSVIFFILFAVLLGAYLLLEYLEATDVYIYLLGFGTNEIMIKLIPLYVLSLVIGVAVFLYKNISRKILATLLIIAVALAALWYLAISLMFASPDTYFEYTSPDNEHQIVARDMSFLLSGGGIIYEKTSFCTLKRVGGYTTDDGFCPFTHDAFYFVWNENDFELHYDYFNAEAEYRVVKMEYAK